MREEIEIAHTDRLATTIEKRDGTMIQLNANQRMPSITISDDSVKRISLGGQIGCKTTFFGSTSHPSSNSTTPTSSFQHITRSDGAQEIRTSCSAAPVFAIEKNAKIGSITLGSTIGKQSFYGSTEDIENYRRLMDKSIDAKQVKASATPLIKQEFILSEERNKLNTLCEQLTSLVSANLLQLYNETISLPDTTERTLLINALHEKLLKLQSNSENIIQIKVFAAAIADAIDTLYHLDETLQNEEVTAEQISNIQNDLNEDHLKSMEKLEQDCLNLFPNFMRAQAEIYLNDIKLLHQNVIFDIQEKLNSYTETPAFR